MFAQICQLRIFTLVSSMVYSSADRRSMVMKQKERLFAGIEKFSRVLSGDERIHENIFVESMLSPFLLNYQL